MRPLTASSRASHFPTLFKGNSFIHKLGYSYEDARRRTKYMHSFNLLFQDIFDL